MEDKNSLKHRAWHVCFPIIPKQRWGGASTNPKDLSQKQWKEHYVHRYREIFLGYKQNEDSTRWLTDREISEGTIQAVECDKEECSIGVLHLWI